MSNQSDEELIKTACDGDTGAFALLVDRYYGMMFKTAYKWCGVREDAEDIAQEAAMKLARNLHSFQFNAAFSTWLYRLVLNTAKDFYRKKNRNQSREVELFEEIQMGAPGENPEDKLAAQQVLLLVDDLPEKLKEAVILVCWDGKTHKEAAEILECAETTISWRVHEARKQLGEQLETEKGAGYGG